MEDHSGIVGSPMVLSVGRLLDWRVVMGMAGI